MEPNTTVADQNTERLIQSAYQPEPVPPEFAASLATLMQATADGLAQQQAAMPAPVARSNRWRMLACVLGGVAACVLMVYALSHFQRPEPEPQKPKIGTGFHSFHNLPKKQPQPIEPVKWTEDVREGMQPRRRPDSAPLAQVKKGDTLTTKPGQRRLVQLSDGTKLFVNEKTEVEVGERQLTLHRGQLYLEVAPKDDAAKFVVKSGNRELTATGTHFAVDANPVAAGVTVTQGKVAVKDTLAADTKSKGGIEVTAGQRVAAGAFAVSAAPRVSHSLEWTRELMAAAESPMVPACQHAGGALLAIDPKGQEIKLALRQYHVDVHIEDGFARTNIDQTYFNTTWERLEGTFYFPLPPDASLSRLAMYVADGNNQCKLMEGGMAERKHAADVYETIRYMRRDPALLEWLDGSTFKMRVFPLEAKQEKRIILSYTQKLPSLYGNARYRFAGGHNMPIVRDWSFTARIKSGAGMTVWSPTHENMLRVPQAGDMLLTLHDRNIKPEQDVVVEMQEPNASLEQDTPRFATFLYENHQYLMLRYRPNLPSLPDRKRRDWIILFESSAQRDPVLAGTQVDVVRQLLKNAEYDDTFTLLTINSKVNAFSDKAQPARPANVEDAVKFLQKTHLVGALDLQKGIDAAIQFAKDAKNPHIVHVGSGTPAMGERDAAKLAQSLPSSATYVGIGVGKRWNRTFMKLAAERTNGLFTQINPDDVVSWRAFELLATLNTPRLLNVEVVDAHEKSQTRFLLETTMLAQGEELCAVTRVDTNRTAIPGKVVVRGILDGKKVSREFTVMNVLPGAGYLPRTWAKQEIDRLLAENAAKNKNEIISLSKAMYVMSPYTSLLVLETDADYERFKVDKGRKDHWAMYQCPPKIPLVYEPEGKEPKIVPKVDAKNKKPSVTEVLRTIAATPLTQGINGIAQAPVFNLDLLDDFEVEALEADIDFGFRLNNRETLNRFHPLRQSNAAMNEWGLLGDEEKRLAGGSGFGKGRPKPAKQPVANQPVRESKLEDLLKQANLNDGLDKRGFGFGRKLGATSAAGGLQAKDRALDGRLLREQSEQLSDVVRRLERGTEPQSIVKERTHLAGEPRGVVLFNDRAKVTKVIRDTKLPEPVLAGLMAAGDEFETLDLPMLQTGERKARALNVTSLRYERPTFGYDAKLFTNLLQYAPGLHTTWADIAATLETEAELPQPKLGAVDAAARKLIDRARAADWASLTIAARGPIPGFKIHYNGLGQFAYEQTLESGLREQVICDGKSLWHLYPEIGLASRRNMSRHHGQRIAAIHPAFVPSADELARGADVKSIDAFTIAVIPFPEADAKADDKQHRVHLIFAADGRLTERRIVEMPLGKVVLKQMFHADGSVEWKNDADKSLAKTERKVAPAQAPSLQPSTRDLVVMELPTRTRSYWIDKWTHDEKPYYIEQTIVSECLTRSSGASVMIHFGKHFHRKGDRRLGFYTLLNASPYAINNAALPPIDKDAWTIDIETEHPGNPLATFLAQEQRELMANDQSLVKKMLGPKDGFIQRLTSFRNLWLTWQTQRAIMNGGQEMPLEKAKVMEFLQETTSPTFAYAILDTMQRRCNVAPSDHMMNIVEKRFGPISDTTGIAYVFRYEQARSLWQAGIGAEAGKRFRDLYADTLKLGVLPPIDSAFRDALQLPVEGAPRFVAHTRKALDEMLTKKQYGLAFQLAKQMEQLGDEAMSDEILTTILEKGSAEERNGLTLVAVNFLAQRKNYLQADRLLAKLLEDKKLATYPDLWRWRSTLNRDANQVATSIACLEKALELEYADLPELVNLESIRTDYRALLTHYQKIADASASLEKSATKVFLAKVIRTADRWRLIDADHSEPSLLAAKILFTMGERELAWDYWTTPIDLHPAESRPWLELAAAMKTEGDLEKADRAFAIAFEAEPTNPEILWNRAQNAVRMGQPDRARQLYRQIADSDWQERFQGIVERARGLAGQ